MGFAAASEKSRFTLMMRFGGGGEIGKLAALHPHRKNRPPVALQVEMGPVNVSDSQVSATCSIHLGLGMLSSERLPSVLGGSNRADGQ